MAYDEKTAGRIRKSLADRPDVVEKPLMGGLCFMVGGAMCCSVSGRGGLLIRVGPAAQAAALSEPHVEPMTMGGRTMKGFVRVAADGYKTDAQLRRWLKRALDFTLTLGVGKPAKRRKASRRA